MSSIKRKPKPCLNPACNEVGFFPYKYCSRPCFNACNAPVYKPRAQIKRTPLKRNATPIKKISDKQRALNAEYSKERKIYLALPENKFCFIDGCKLHANTIEHRKGRKGFADTWARENNIPLLLDKRFWAPCCNPHNLELENNPELSKQYQLSKIHNGKKGGE